MVGPCTFGIKEIQINKKNPFDFFPSGAKGNSQ